MSQDRFACLGCGRIVAVRRHDRVAPTASGRVLIVQGGAVKIACVVCGAHQWVTVTKAVVS